MYYISIYGFNKKLKKHKIYNILSTAVFGKKLPCHFCLHDIHPDADPKFIVVLITLGDKLMTQKAISLINGFVYFDYHTKTELQLSAIDTTEHLKDAYNSDDQSIKDKEVRQRRRSHGSHESRYRSRSPHSANDMNKIDVEIDLIQKERLLIVEQRKLLLEKKRLELLKEFEPTSITDLERFAAAIVTQDDHEQKPGSLKPAKVRGTPVPVLASRAIVKQMKEAIAKRSDTNDITQPLYFTLRKRIIEIIKGKSNLETEDIIQMYRENYPIESDEGLLDCLEEQMNTIKAVKNISEKGVSHVEKDESGPSNIDKVNNEESNKESEKKEATLEFTDNELDDWLEDDKVNQDGNDVDDTKQVPEVDTELAEEEVKDEVDLEKNEL